MIILCRRYEHALYSLFHTTCVANPKVTVSDIYQSRGGGGGEGA